MPSTSLLLVLGESGDWGKCAAGGWYDAAGVSRAILPFAAVLASVAVCGGLVVLVLVFVAGEARRALFWAREAAVRVEELIL